MGRHAPAKWLRHKEAQQISGFGHPRCYKGAPQTMPLMTYLHRHPKTGVYWFRRAVPPALRLVLGRREITESLRTKNPSEAKARLPAVAARAAAVLAAVQGGGTG